MTRERMCLGCGKQLIVGGNNSDWEGLQVHNLDECKLAFVRKLLEKDSRLMEMGELMRTQDNRITADPIFMVRQRKRIYGMDQDYAGDDYVWSDKEANELIVYSDEELDAWIEKENTVGFQDEKCKWSRDDFEKIFYVDVWEDVQPFFTEVAANQYIVANRHNLTDPHVYVKCAYRNWEWQLLREFLMEGGKSESGEEDQANDYV